MKFVGPDGRTWRGYLTTSHPSSNYGLPVLLEKRAKTVYRPGDLAGVSLLSASPAEREALRTAGYEIPDAEGVTMVTLRGVPLTLARAAKSAAARAGLTLEAWAVAALRAHLDRSGAEALTREEFAAWLGAAEQLGLMADPLEAEFWRGYARGLRRLHHGERFGSADEHSRWLALADDPTPDRRALGLGYRAGLEGLPVGEARTRFKE